MEKTEGLSMENHEIMDPLCILLCDVLNSVSGIKTTESCCGHGKTPYRIWFKCLKNDSYGLSLITRAIDRRYSNTNLMWTIRMETVDTIDPGYMSASFLLESDRPYLTEDEINQDINQIIDNISHWGKPEYGEFFGMMTFYSPRIKF